MVNNTSVKKLEMCNCAITDDSIDVSFLTLICDFTYFLDFICDIIPNQIGAIYSTSM